MILRGNKAELFVSHSNLFCTKTIESPGTSCVWDSSGQERVEGVTLCQVALAPWGRDIPPACCSPRCTRRPHTRRRWCTAWCQASKPPGEYISGDWNKLELQEPPKWQVAIREAPKSCSPEAISHPGFATGCPFQVGRETNKATMRVDLEVATGVVKKHFTPKKSLHGITLL